MKAIIIRFSSATNEIIIKKLLIVENHDLLHSIVRSLESKQRQGMYYNRATSTPSNFFPFPNFLLSLKPVFDKAFEVAIQEWILSNSIMIMELS